MTLTNTKTYAKTDRELQQDVQAELNRDWRFKPAEVGVEVDSGVVTLTGTVSSYRKLGQAAQLATKVSGVKDVANKLTVAGPYTLDDTMIAGNVRDALTLDFDVPEERIDSVVRDGVVTLSGKVDYWTQREAAHDAVARLGGVRNVNNHIAVAPATRTDQELFEEIRGTIRRRLRFTDIDVSVDKLNVTLMGKVGTYQTRTEAERIAWSTHGVKDVHNKLVVNV
jgi:osmotically-inducible protein OsmY